MEIPEHIYVSVRKRILEVLQTDVCRRECGQSPNWVGRLDAARWVDHVFCEFGLLPDHGHHAVLVVDLRIPSIIVTVEEVGFELEVRIP